MDDVFSTINNRPIGVFDSGVGGLSIWAALVDLMPDESFIYFADIKNCPYGSQSKEAIQKLSLNIINWLIERDCKLIVIACNTATAAGIDVFRQHSKVPIIGVEPAIKLAAKQTKTGSVGVLATEGTLKSELFNNTTNRFASHIDVIVQIGHGLVTLVESGDLDSNLAETTLRKFIEPMMKKNVDQVVLGCTHYPFLIPLIDKITKKEVNIINPAPDIARHTKNTLKKFKLEAMKDNNVFHRFVTYKNSNAYERLGQQVMREAGIKHPFVIEEIKTS